MSYWFWGDLTPVVSRLDELKALLTRLERRMATDLSALESQVKANTDAEGAAVLLLTQLHELLVAAQGDPAKLSSLIAQLGASKDALAAAILANTPSA